MDASFFNYHKIPVLNHHNHNIIPYTYIILGVVVLTRILTRETDPLPAR